MSLQKLSVCTIREHLLKSKQQDILNILSSTSIFRIAFQNKMVRGTWTGELCSAPRSGFTTWELWSFFAENEDHYSVSALWRCKILCFLFLKGMRYRERFENNTEVSGLVRFTLSFSLNSFWWNLEFNRRWSDVEWKILDLITIAYISVAAIVVQTVYRGNNDS